MLSKGPLEDPGGVSHKPRGVSRGPHSAADIHYDLLCFVEFVPSVAAALPSKREVLTNLHAIADSRGPLEDPGVGVSQTPEGGSKALS